MYLRVADELRAATASAANNSFENFFVMIGHHQDDVDENRPI